MSNLMHNTHTTSTAPSAPLLDAKSQQPQPESVTGLSGRNDVGDVNDLRQNQQWNNSQELAGNPTRPFVCGTGQHLTGAGTVPGAQSWGQSGDKWGSNPQPQETHQIGLTAQAPIEGEGSDPQHHRMPKADFDNQSTSEIRSWAAKGQAGELYHGTLPTTTTDSSQPSLESTQSHLAQMNLNSSSQPDYHFTQPTQPTLAPAPALVGQEICLKDSHPVGTSGDLRVRNDSKFPADFAAPGSALVGDTHLSAHQPNYRSAQLGLSDSHLVNQPNYAATATQPLLPADQPAYRTVPLGLTAETRVPVDQHHGSSVFDEAAKKASGVHARAEARHMEEEAVHESALLEHKRLEAKHKKDEAKHQKQYEKHIKEQEKQQKLVDKHMEELELHKREAEKHERELELARNMKEMERRMKDSEQEMKDEHKEMKEEARAMPGGSGAKGGLRDVAHKAKVAMGLAK